MEDEVILATEQQQELLGDWLDWTYGELPVSQSQIVIHMESANPFVDWPEQAIVDYLLSLIDLGQK